MSMKCRVWWPNDLSSSSSSNLVLFGWVISSSPTSLDIVVAFAFHQHFLSLRSHHSALQVVISHAHKAMPVRLQDKFKLTLLGLCGVPSENECVMCKLDMVDGNHNKPLDFPKFPHVESSSSASSINRSCEILEDDGLLKQYKHAYSLTASWIQLIQGGCGYSSDVPCLVPTLHHLHWNGKLISSVELHVMIYETPRYCSHHFSTNSPGSNCTPTSSRSPKWLHELGQKPQLIELDMVIVAINSSAAAKFNFSRHLRSGKSHIRLSILCTLLNLTWRVFAAIVATLSTLLYIVFQAFHKLAGYALKFRICNAVKNVFSNTLINIQHRGHQLLYWPVFLDDSALRSQACVEFAEKAGLRRHSLWSSAMVDIFLGNLLGYILLFHINTVSSLILNFASHFTDDVLRTGCVWLMGVPAGFKLNTELAGVLGAISLNAIQIWSTLWFLAGHIFFHIIRVVAFLGILLGMTISAALIIDMIAIAAFHVRLLHQFVGFFYSLQIEALTALWRLFRGRKWNPLRHRLDSYEYSVEQHVVGSLMFTPLLLLLPTTSVFYIFFAIMSLTIMFLRAVVHIIVSVIHDTPYAKIVLWFVRPKRFPSGIWFEIMRSQRDSISVTRPLADTTLCSNRMLKDQNLNSRNSMLPPLFLHSNIMTFGQVVIPHYRDLFSRIHGPNAALAVSGILTGKSITTQESETRRKMPWFSISYTDYWSICYRAVLASKQ